MSLRAMSTAPAHPTGQRSAQSPPRSRPRNDEMSSDHDRPINEQMRCELTGELLPKGQLVVMDHLRPAIAERIRQDCPLLGPDALISRAEADRSTGRSTSRRSLGPSAGELTELDRQVARSLEQNEILSQNV